MKLLLSLLVLGVASASTNEAQEKPETPPPTRARSAPATSPEVQPDRRVTFRFRAPQAKEVTVSGQGIDGKVPLEKAEDGEWSVTVGPIEPGVYEYSLNVDGVQMIDPRNPAIKPQRQPRTSILHIPGDPALAWDFQDVPHGTVHQHTYRSKTLETKRDFFIYTPPGYERSSEAKFPVLFLIHGFGDSAATWTVHGKAHWILDNLIASGRAKPMIVVMPDGHPIAPGAGFRDEYGRANSEALEREVIDEILPLVEATYRVQTDAAGRAIAGLSMGGGHSLHTGLRNLEKFGWIGAFSAAPPADDRVSEAFANSEATNQKLKLLWIACGKRDFLIERNRKLVTQLGEKGIRHTWSETEGDHSWPVWRKYLAEFAPLLFQNTPQPAAPR